MATTTGPSPYAEIVSSLRSSLNFLESSVRILDSGVCDYPRLIKHYELIPQTTLAAAEASLRDEIGPYIALLLSRAEAQVGKQDRRIETLKARAELQQGRLSRPGEADRSAAPTARKLVGEDKLRARIVRQRKEALRYGVERLELEVLQKERELRRRLDG
ncbi:hypothetical protein UVI_02048920 [Ustilaginoidea virens]|uniref:DASH complex subunit SPC19 n=1 Tax=Ustilaginoidea virens TaxID=1159556 RepID=A0A1B5KVK9_USTVR|nr:hypothetical protein UVI_02048920 [Ustilaginoidea virens]